MLCIGHPFWNSSDSYYNSYGSRPNKSEVENYPGIHVCRCKNDKMIRKDLVARFLIAKMRYVN